MPVLPDKDGQINSARWQELFKLQQFLLKQHDFSSLATHIINYLTPHFPESIIKLYLVDESGKQWYPYDKPQEKTAIPAGIIGFVTKHKTALHLAEQNAHAAFDPHIDQAETSSVIIPVLPEPEYAAAVISIHRAAIQPFSESDFNFMMQVAEIVAPAFNRIGMKMEFASLVESLATALDARDYISAGHSRRVTAYAQEIGRIMKLDDGELENLRLAGLLHDIGKIGVPELVLFKDRQLDEVEFEIIKRHATITESILSKIRFLGNRRLIPEIAATHHEHIDGTGYPGKLTDEQIPAGGKILAVADVFDALTSRRTNTDRLSLEEVMAVIDGETATTFDPFIVYNFKHILLDRLLCIMEMGPGEEIVEADRNRLRDYRLRDLLELRKDGGQSEINNLFMHYYGRHYRKK